MERCEEHRLSYNAWMERTGLSEERPPELFFRGELFMLEALTSRYLKTNYVLVHIVEHSEYETDLTTTDGYTWTGEL